MPIDDATRGAFRDQAEATLNSIGDAVLSTDIDGNVAYLNLAAETMTGWSRQSAVGRPFDEVLHIVDRKTRQIARNPMSLAIELDRTVKLSANCVLVRRGGQEIEIEDSASPVHDRDGRVIGAVIVFRDVGAALETSRQMSHLAQHDALTGLPNRLLLNDRLTATIALAHRRRRSLAVLFVDIDGFKTVNDALGHVAADHVLRSIATRLAGALRQSDAVSRYGGDEFVVVLSEIEDAYAASLVATKVLQAVAWAHQIDGRDVRVTASVGVSVYPDHGHDAATLIACADAAMYDAKRAGTGTYRLSPPAGSLDGQRQAIVR